MYVHKKGGPEGHASASFYYITTFTTFTFSPYLLYCIFLSFTYLTNILYA